MNDRIRGINIDKNGGIGTVGVHGEVMTAISIIDITKTWCNQFGKEQLKATLTDVQYNPKSDLNLVSIGKLLRRAGSLVGSRRFGTGEGQCKAITTKNGGIFCAYLQRDQEVSTILTIYYTGAAISIENAHIITGHHDEE